MTASDSSFEDGHFFSHSSASLLMGVDEVGRGPLAGPVVATAVGVNLSHSSHRDRYFSLIQSSPHGITDSKKLTDKKRKSIFEKLHLPWDLYQHETVQEFTLEGLSFLTSSCAISAEEIDEINILQASLKAMRVAALQVYSECPASSILLIDGNKHCNTECSQIEEVPLVKGDLRCFIISLSSTIAKVLRDTYMTHLACEYPQYSWEQNKAYPTKVHLEAIKRHGACIYHRKSFAGVKNSGKR